MKTFYTEKELKESLLKYTKEHQEVEAYMRGSLLFTEEKLAKNGSIKGCFYGCMTQSSEKTFEKASNQYGLPLWYVHVTERIYEGLPESEWLSFPYEAIEILPVGIDMNIIRSRFNYFLLKDQLRFTKKESQQYKAIIQCMNLYTVSFNNIDRSAAESAFKSAFKSGAWSAAWSAESAAESSYYIWMKNLLFECIKNNSLDYVINENILEAKPVK